MQDIMANNYQKEWFEMAKDKEWRRLEKEREKKVTNSFWIIFKRNLESSKEVCD